MQRRVNSKSNPSNHQSNNRKPYAEYPKSKHHQPKPKQPKPLKTTHQTKHKQNISTQQINQYKAANPTQNTQTIYQNTTAGDQTNKHSGDQTKPQQSSPNRNANTNTRTTKATFNNTLHTHPTQ